ncbi:MAG: alpha/beta hydrolase [Pseudomonadales bacterium]|nr:alpha/beta hydrolase [Pseudomonadales bacterium]
MASRILSTNFGNIAIEESAGRGTPLLFIHGNSSCKEIFKHQFAGAIGEKYHCIAMDLPGHGESDNAHDPEQTYTIPRYADVAIAVMENLNLSSYAILGWSLGGHIGIEMMSRATDVKGLLISGTPPVGSDPNDMSSAFRPTEHMAFTGQEILSDEQAEQYAHATCGSGPRYECFLGDAVRRTDGRARRIMMEAAMRGEGVDQKNEVMDNETPLAIINGADEAMINNEYLTTIEYKNLWEETVHLIENAGHAPFLESPHDFDVLLDRFMRSL